MIGYDFHIEWGANSHGIVWGLAVVAMVLIVCAVGWSAERSRKDDDD